MTASLYAAHYFFRFTARSVIAYLSLLGACLYVYLVRRLLSTVAAFLGFLPLHTYAAVFRVVQGLVKAHPQLRRLQQQLGIKDVSLLRLALTHPSFSSNNNKRLAWIGDALLYLMVSKQLDKAMPLAGNDELTMRRIQIIRREACAERAAALGWDKLLVVGRTHETYVEKSMVAEMFEAVWGALYMDRGNVEAVYELYCKLCPLVL